MRSQPAVADRGRVMPAGGDRRRQVHGGQRIAGTVRGPRAVHRSACLGHDGSEPYGRRGRRARGKFTVRISEPVVHVERSPRSGLKNGNGWPKTRAISELVQKRYTIKLIESYFHA